VNKEYLKRIVPNLNKVTGLEFSQAEDLIDATQHMDAFVSVSGSVKSCAVALSKIASDLRLLSSGPRTGLGEINLPAKQNGSSIMPGKVNPVIPEVVNQVAFNVIGNDVAIALAAQSGQLELNAFTPIILYNLFQSIDTLTFAIETFIDNCIVGITANKEKCRNDVDKSISVVTVIAPIVGYDKASEIAKRAQNENRSVKEIILEENILTKEEIKQLLDPIKMTEPQ
jgi:aspartate ammonia-lyase